MYFFNWIYFNSFAHDAVFCANINAKCCCESQWSRIGDVADIKQHDGDQVTSHEGLLSLLSSFFLSLSYLIFPLSLSLFLSLSRYWVFRGFVFCYHIKDCSKTYFNLFFTLCMLYLLAFFILKEIIVTQIQKIKIKLKFVVN